MNFKKYFYLQPASKWSSHVFSITLPIKNEIPGRQSIRGPSLGNSYYRMGTKNVKKYIKGQQGISVYSLKYKNNL